MKEKIKEQKISNKSTATKVADIIGIVVVILLLPILIVNSILIIKGLCDKKTVPSLFGYTPLVVETNSMVPTFSGNDLIVVKSVGNGTLQTQDVISFYEPTVSDHSVVVSHRIIGIVYNDDGTTSYRTQGDANNTPDSTIVPESEVIGKYVTKFTGFGKFVKLLSTTQGMLWFVVLPLVLVFGIDSALRQLDSKKREDKEKKEDNKDNLSA